MIDICGHFQNDHKNKSQAELDFVKYTIIFTNGLAGKAVRMEN